MRLLKLTNNDGVSQTDDITGKVPSYAILSHTWASPRDEVSFYDLEYGTEQLKPGYDKIKFCGMQAKKDGLIYFWVDSCCIDKKNNAELSEAIISMFRWYQSATRCYVYLSDVSAPDEPHRHLDQWQPQLRNSKWFTRGWTLQELLAPRSVEFFSREGKLLGDKSSLELLIHEVTKIPIAALRGAAMSNFTVKQRLSWASQRDTTREEDLAYCLQGLFGVYMVPMYGEERANAQLRLERAIEERFHEPKKSSGSYQLNPLEVSQPEPSEQKIQIRKKAILEALRFDQINDRHANIRPNHARTCRWLLQSSAYRNWIDHNKLAIHGGFFWIKGKAGSGKSTLVKYTLGKLKEIFPDSLLISFFFHARGVILEKSTLGLYRSLIFQLLEKNLDHDQFWKSWTDLKSDDGSFLSQLQSNTEKLREIIYQIIESSEGDSVIIVVDALDEGTNDDDVRDMVAFFENLSDEALNSGRNLRILLSSRHYPHISVRRSVDLTITNEEGHTQDIERYLATELRARTDDTTQTLGQEIRNRAAGVFLWVVLVVQILNKLYDKGQAHRLQKRLQEIPSDLGTLFQSIITRDQHNVAEMQMCLRWILFAQRPLAPSELYFAILAGTEPDELPKRHPVIINQETIELFILSSSKGLAEIINKKSSAATVQFIHESVRDFLIKEHMAGQNLIQDGEDIEGSIHDQLKMCCKVYLDSIKTPVPLSESSHYVEEPRSKYSDRPSLAIIRYPWSFLEYSVHAIFHHANIAQRCGFDQTSFLQCLVDSDLMRFFGPWGVEMAPVNNNRDLLYILARDDYYHLLRIWARIGRCQPEPVGKFGNPIFATIAQGHRKSYAALMAAERQRHPNGCRFPYKTPKALMFLFNHCRSHLALDCLDFFTFDMTEGFMHQLLRQAEREMYAKCIEILLRKILALGSENLYGVALQIAVVAGFVNIAELLLDNGASANGVSKYHGTLLSTAAGSGNNVPMVELLLSRGADINKFCPVYGSSLHAARVKGNIRISKLLTDKGAL